MKIKITAAVVALLVLTGGAWAWWSNRPDPQLVKAEALSEKIRQQSKGMPDFSKPEVREQLKELRAEVEAMPEKTREQFMEGRREEMQQQFQEQLDRYFAMTPEEKKKELDRMLDGMSNMRKAFEKERAEREKNGAGNGTARASAAGGGAPSGGTAGGGAPSGRGPGPGFGPPGGFSRDPAERQAMRKKMLDSTSPQFRAKSSEFMKDMFARMKERGMEVPFGGRPPF